jgi:surfactin synthase thioesterase subunit
LTPQPASRVRLVCFPFAGGAAGYFHWLSDLLGPDVEVLGVQYPGRQGRWQEPVIEDIEILADQIDHALAPWAAQPLAFLGHSMGAVVAFEVARRFARYQRRPPLALFVSGHRAPSIHRIQRLDLSDDAALLAELRSLGGTDPALFADDDLLEMILPVIRGDFRAIHTYQGPTEGAVLDVPIIAMIGDQDSRVSFAEADAWRAHTTSDFSLHVLAGGHFYLADNAAEFARLIIRGLAGR